MVIALFLVACGTSEPTPEPVPPVEAPTEAPKEVITGGWTTQDAAMIDEETIDRFAALLRDKQQDPSIEIAAVETYETQVVAGINHKATLDLRTKDGPKKVTVTVFQALDQTWTITDLS
jgi:hypothetical protein